MAADICSSSTGRFDHPTQPNQLTLDLARDPVSKTKGGRNQGKILDISLWLTHMHTHIYTPEVSQEAGRADKTSSLLHVIPLWKKRSKAKGLAVFPGKCLSVEMNCVVKTYSHVSLISV